MIADKYLEIQERFSFWGCAMKQSGRTNAALRSRQADREALSRREAAALLGVSEGMMIKLVRLGRVGAIRIGKCVRIPRTEINRILREGVR